MCLGLCAGARGKYGACGCVGEGDELWRVRMPGCDRQAVTRELETVVPGGGRSVLDIGCRQPVKCLGGLTGWQEWSPGLNRLYVAFWMN